MSIDTIKVEKPFDFYRDIRGGHLMTPFMKEFLKHTEGTAFGDFAETAKDTEFFVGHSHIDFIGLNVVVGYGLEFGGGGGVEEFF